MSLDLSTITTEHNVAKEPEPEPQMNSEEVNDDEMINENDFTMNMDIPQMSNIEMTYGVDRRRQILILELYINEFGNNKLRNYKHIKFDKLSACELQGLHDEFNYVLGSKSNISVAVELFKKGVETFEYVADEYSPLRMNGLSQVVNNDPEIIDDFKHMAIERLGLLGKTEPHHRLMFNMAKAVINVHNFNTYKQGQTSNARSFVNNINDNYDDL